MVIWVQHRSLCFFCGIVRHKTAFIGYMYSLYVLWCVLTTLITLLFIFWLSRLVLFLRREAYMPCTVLFIGEKVRSTFCCVFLYCNKLTCAHNERKFTIAEGNNMIQRVRERSSPCRFFECGIPNVSFTLQMEA